jgi:hypothetical protein
LGWGYYNKEINHLVPTGKRTVETASKGFYNISSATNFSYPKMHASVTSALLSLQQVLNPSAASANSK